MRPLLISLLLLCMLLAAADAGHCDDALIIIADKTQIDYKRSPNMLKCKDKNNKKQDILLGGHSYASLSCTTAGGWKGTTGDPDPGKRAGEPINIQCVDKVATVAACDEALIGQFDGNIMKYDPNTKELSCKISHQVVKYTDGGDKIASIIKCPAAGKWTADATPTGIDRTAKITVSGCEDAPACHKAWITLNEAQVKYNDGTPASLSCSDVQKKLKMGTDTEVFDTLTCDKATGWSANSQVKKTSKEAFAVSCVAPPPPECITTADSEIHRNEVGNIVTITCNADRKALKIGDKPLYASLKCEGGQWKDEDGTSDIGHASTVILDAACKDFCTAGTDIVLTPDNGQPGQFTATCSGLNSKMFNGAVAAPKADQVVTCSLKDGWKSTTDGFVNGIAETPLPDLQCKQACGNYQMPDPTDATAWLDGLTTDAEQSTEADGTIVFKCKKQKIGEDKNAIKLNDNLVLSHLKCNAAEGYTDIANKKLAEPFDQVKIVCEKSLCKIRGGGACKIVERPARLPPKGYSCPGASNKREPQLATDDPNMLNCKTSKSARFYDTVKSMFHDYPLRCGYNDIALLDGFIWYKFDDDSKENLVSDASKILCLEHTCATCSKLLTGTPAGAIPSVDTNGTESVFTEGTPTECATAKCPNNLWSVDKMGSNIIEEYAGEVTCSSSSEEADQKKWLIDGETEIYFGSCITAVASCISAVKLRLECDEEWKTMRGCEKVTLSDDAPVTCTAPKQMFYKPRDLYGFLDGATEIQCDKTEGVWNVKTKSGVEDKLRRGGTVICANQNPAPTTTTLAPTTTTPLVLPCDACPKIESLLLKCDECSNKADIIKTVNTDNNKVCEAFPEDYAPTKTLKTEKGTMVDKLFCNKTMKIWATKDGETAEKFASLLEPVDTSEQSLLVIIGAAVGGVIVLLIIFGVIFKVCISKKRPEKDDETKRKMLEEGRKKKKKLGDNDDILDQVSVDVPSEIKL